MGQWVTESREWTGKVREGVHTEESRLLWRGGCQKEGDWTHPPHPRLLQPWEHSPCCWDRATACTLVLIPDEFSIKEQGFIWKVKTELNAQNPSSSLDLCPSTLTSHLTKKPCSLSSTTSVILYLLLFLKKSFTGLHFCVPLSWVTLEGKKLVITKNGICGFFFKKRIYFIRADLLFWHIPNAR